MPETTETTTLQDIIARLPELPNEDDEGEEIDHMIFAAKTGGTWQPDSLAAIIPFRLDAEEYPTAPEGMTYFPEASIAEEVIEAYKAHAGTRYPSLEEQTTAVIYYATYDAYLPVKRP